MYTNEEPFHSEKPLHKTFGIKENKTYFERKGAYIIPIKGDAVGVVETPKGYFLIGGGIHTGETARQCIVRECIEETGYQVEIMEQICWAEMYCEHPTIGYFHPMQFYYSGELLQRMQKPTEADHVFRWIGKVQFLKKSAIRFSHGSDVIEGSGAIIVAVCENAFLYFR